jgi:hypothetical protein
MIEDTEEAEATPNRWANAVMERLSEKDRQPLERARMALQRYFPQFQITVRCFQIGTHPRNPPIGRSARQFSIFFSCLGLQSIPEWRFGKDYARSLHKTPVSEVRGRPPGGRLVADVAT